MQSERQDDDEIASHADDRGSQAQPHRTDQSQPLQHVVDSQQVSIRHVRRRQRSRGMVHCRQEVLPFSRTNALMRSQDLF